jgi:hypothetical protein
MASSSLFGKVARWARTPQGQRVISEATRRAQQVAKDPATRAKVQRIRGKIGTSGITPSKRTGPDPETRPPGAAPR